MTDNLPVLKDLIHLNNLRIGMHFGPYLLLQSLGIFIYTKPDVAFHVASNFSLLVRVTKLLKMASALYFKLIKTDSYFIIKVYHRD